MGSDPRMTRVAMVYPTRVLDSFPNCLRKVKFWIPEATTQYVKGPDGALRRRIPAIHRVSKQLVWLEAPTTNCAEAAVFRDCPDFDPYTTDRWCLIADGRHW